jgi:hypothetical protein
LKLLGAHEATHISIDGGMCTGDDGDGDRMRAGKASAPSRSSPHSEECGRRRLLSGYTHPSAGWLI